MKLPALLVVLDGFGLQADSESNAITHAKTPVIDSLFNAYPHTKLHASGEAVGLPKGQMGNSEVGHLNLGAGRIIKQEMTRISGAIKDGSFFDNHVLNGAIDAAQVSDGAVHVMGLFSDGGVHSSLEHAKALVKLAADKRVEEVYLHAFLDGRDVSPVSGAGFIRDMTSYAATISEQTGTRVQLASVIGRYYAMDRDNRWERVEKAYQLIAKAEGEKIDNAPKVLEDYYKQGTTDEFMGPLSLTNRGVKDGDTIIFFNFRPDRARELTRAFVDVDFAEFTREKRDISFVCLTEYDSYLPAAVAFEKEIPQQVLADVLAEQKLHQLHAAETEKYAHVTFFFNGGLETPKEGESRLLINSPKVATYDLKPSMSAIELTDSLVESIDKDEAEVYIVNYANCDMVGHTGIFDAAVEAVETVDTQLGRLLEAIQEKNGFALVTADHGNVDCMFTVDSEGNKSPVTSHTLAPVPLIMINGPEGAELNEGKLADVAPTLLDIIGIEAPEAWTGQSLILR